MARTYPPPARETTQLSWRPLLVVGVILAFLWGAFASSALAMGELLISPTRVTFEGNNRTAAVTLTNTGTEAATYRISLVRRRMTEAGELLDVTSPQPGEAFADSLVRFSPSEVVLPPGATQTIRLQVRKPAALADGEYRCHLLMRAIPNPDSAGKNIEAVQDQKGQYAVRLTPILGFTIPVIVRHGETSAQGQMSSLKLVTNPTTHETGVDVTLTRNGNRSLYGHLFATFVHANGTEEELGRLNGISVYVPNTARRVMLPLKKKPAPHGRLKVRFEDAVTAEVITSLELKLP